MKQLRICPHVVLQLIYHLVEQDHEVFRGEGASIELKAQMRAAVEREYPETDGHLPEEQRQGHVPDSLCASSRKPKRSTSLD